MARKINEIVDSTLHKQSEPHSTSNTEGTDFQKRMIQELFMVMRATWGNKYTSQFKELDDVKLAMRVWLRAFRRNDKDMLHQALANLALQLEWPPTIEQMTAEVKRLEAERTVFQRALPKPASPATAAVREKELQRMKKIVHG